MRCYWLREKLLNRASRVCYGHDLRREVQGTHAGEDDTHDDG